MEANPIENRSKIETWKKEAEKRSITRKGLQKGSPKSSETAQRIQRGTTGAPKWDEGDVKKKIGKKGRKKGAEKNPTSATLGAFLFRVVAAGG